MKKLLFIPVFFFLVSSASAQWNGSGGSYPGVTSDGANGLNVAGAVAMSTSASSSITYGSAGTSVTLDLSKTNHYINLTPATTTTGVSIYVVNAPTLTSQDRTYKISIKQAGSVAGLVVWTLAGLQCDSGASPTLTTTVGATDLFALIYSSETGTTKTLVPGGSGIK